MKIGPMPDVKRTLMTETGCLSVFLDDFGEGISRRWLLQRLRIKVMAHLCTQWIFSGSDIWSTGAEELEEQHYLLDLEMALGSTPLRRDRSTARCPQGQHGPV